MGSIGDSENSFYTLNATRFLKLGIYAYNYNIFTYNYPIYITTPAVILGIVANIVNMICFFKNGLTDYVNLSFFGK